jgi:Rv2632c-like
MPVPIARLTMESQAIGPSGGGNRGCHFLLTHPAALDSEQREFDSLNRFSEAVPWSRALAVRIVVLASGPSKEGFMPEQSWHINVSFTEDADRTRADAILELADQKFHGFGHAKRAPDDPSVPVIGQELAVARALSDLSHQLLEAAADRIGSFEGHRVNLHG